MRDMFYNYEHQIDKKEYPCNKECMYTDKPAELKNDGNIALIFDVKGNQLGVEIKRNSPVSLYFNVCGHIDNYSVNEFLLNCQSINFEIIDHRHKVILSKILDPQSVVDHNSIKVDLSSSDYDNLYDRSYKVSLTAIWAGGMYNLFTERDGLLIIR